MPGHHMQHGTYMAPGHVQWQCLEFHAWHCLFVSMFASKCPRHICQHTTVTVTVSMTEDIIILTDLMRKVKKIGFLDNITKRLINSVRKLQISVFFHSLLRKLINFVETEYMFSSTFNQESVCARNWQMLFRWKQPCTLKCYTINFPCNIALLPT